MPQTWTFIAKLNSTCVPLRFLSIWKWAKGNNKTINDKEGNENEKVKSVELSRQIQMMWAMQPTKLTHGTSPLSHVAVCINTTEWISLYFILHFKCVDTLRFLWIQDMKAEIKLLFISLLFQTFCLPARLKSFFYCVYTKHMLKCIFFFFFLPTAPNLAHEQNTGYLHLFLEFFSHQSVGLTLFSSKPFSPLSLLHFHDRHPSSDIC